MRWVAHSYDRCNTRTAAFYQPCRAARKRFQAFLTWHTDDLQLRAVDRIASLLRLISPRLRNFFSDTSILRTSATRDLPRDRSLLLIKSLES